MTIRSVIRLVFCKVAHDMEAHRASEMFDSPSVQLLIIK